MIPQNHPLDSLKTPYFVAPATFFIVTWSKPYKEAVAKYEAEKQSRKAQQEADRAKARHEAEERARDAELDAKIAGLRDTSRPRPSPTPDLNPEAKSFADRIDQLFKRQ